MSQSKSLKADKDAMWKKLSTLPDPTPIPDWWAPAGYRRGELVVIATSKGTGKSVYMDIESTG